MRGPVAVFTLASCKVKDSFIIYKPALGTARSEISQQGCWDSVPSCYVQCIHTPQPVCAHSMILLPFLQLEYNAQSAFNQNSDNAQKISKKEAIGLRVASTPTN